MDVPSVNGGPFYARWEFTATTCRPRTLRNQGFHIGRLFRANINF
jgi:hypothetical protein